MSTQDHAMDRREALRGVGLMFGGVAFVGGSRLLDAFEGDVHGRAQQIAQAGRGVGEFTAAEIAFLDEVADTILPTTSTPGAKAAKTGAFMAVMVRDTYEPRDQQVFRAGMKSIDDATQKAHSVSFMKATPEQRLSILTQLDKDQKSYMDARREAEKKAAEAHLPDQRKEAAPGAEANAATAITEKPPAHYSRMMKELALLGYFTSEIGMTQALRYVEAPGRYDPCVPYKPGEKAWASHA